MAKELSPTKRENLAKAELAEIDAALRAIELEEKLNALAPTVDRPFKYVFTKHVNDKTVKKALQQLDGWHHTNPEAPIEFTINSPGGYVSSGMHLFDELAALSKRGGGTHEVTTVVRGTSCSMGAILSQAGDVRVMGARALLMIHQPSGMSWGVPGEHRDNLDCLNRMTEQMVHMFVERSGGKCGREYFLQQVERRDWWLDSRECLNLGFIDRIG